MPEAAEAAEDDPGLAGGLSPPASAADIAQPKTQAAIARRQAAGNVGLNLIC